MEKGKTMNIIENIEKEQMEKLLEGKNIPDFKAGDTLKVHTKVKEGDRERIHNLVRCVRVDVMTICRLYLWIKNFLVSEFLSA